MCGTACAPADPFGVLLGNFNTLNRLEELIMTTQAEAFAALGAKGDAALAAVQDLTDDFRAFVVAMTAERENLSTDGQAAFDEAKAKADAAAAALASLDTEVGDADGSDTPPPVDPEPAPE